MRRLTPYALLPLFVGSVGWRVGVAYAGADDAPKARTGQYPLRGLQGVHVVVKPINPDAERDGLDKERIQTWVEDRLRKAGIHILSREESLHTPGSPCLYVRIGAVKHPEDLYAYSTQVMLAEEVQLKRDPSIRTIATTWNTGGVAPVGRHYLRNAVRQSVEDKVDLFINDFLAANPKGRVGRLRSPPAAPQQDDATD